MHSAPLWNKRRPFVRWVSVWRVCAYVEWVCERERETLKKQSPLWYLHVIRSAESFQIISLAVFLIIILCYCSSRACINSKQTLSSPHVNLSSRQAPQLKYFCMCIGAARAFKRNLFFQTQQHAAHSLCRRANKKASVKIMQLGLFPLWKDWVLFKWLHFFAQALFFPAAAARFRL